MNFSQALVLHNMENHAHVSSSDRPDLLMDFQALQKFFLESLNNFGLSASIQHSQTLLEKLSWIGVDAKYFINKPEAEIRVNA